MKSIRYERGGSLRNIHDKKSIYIMFARGRGHRAPMKERTTRILWHIASKLIRGKETFQAPGDSAITGHLLMGRTCASSEYSRSSGHPDPRDIVADMIRA
jgi:hypothetical protein